MQVQDLRQIHPAEQDHPLVTPFSHSVYKSSARTAARLINQDQRFLTFFTTLAKITHTKKSSDNRVVLFLRLTPRRAEPFICSPRPELCWGGRSDSKHTPTFWKRTAGVSQMLPGSNNVLIQGRAQTHVQRSHMSDRVGFEEPGVKEQRLLGKWTPTRAWDLLLGCRIWSVCAHHVCLGFCRRPHGRCYLWYIDLSGRRGSSRTKKSTELGRKATNHILPRLLSFQNLDKSINRPETGTGL